MDKNKREKEFCVYIRNGRGSPYNISPYHNFEDALVALNNMVSLEIERGRFFYVDNDFYDNKYPPNMYGKYFCIMERNVTQWEKYESVSAKRKNSKNNQCKILMFRQKIK